jgi:ATP-dependent Clp protease ATP-binding subunit ClpX
MLDVMYELPGKSQVRECVVTDEVVARKKDPILVYDSGADWAR